MYVLLSCPLPPTTPESRQFHIKSHRYKSLPSLPRGSQVRPGGRSIRRVFHCGRCPIPAAVPTPAPVPRPPAPPAAPASDAAAADPALAAAAAAAAAEARMLVAAGPGGSSVRCGWAEVEGFGRINYCRVSRSRLGWRGGGQTFERDWVSSCCLIEVVSFVCGKYALNGLQRLLTAR